MNRQFRLCGPHDPCQVLKQAAAAGKQLQSIYEEAGAAVCLQRQVTCWSEPVPALLGHSGGRNLE